MKKLLISCVVAGSFAGMPVVYADDAHHPEKVGAPESKTTPGKDVLPKQPAAPDKAMSGTGGVADDQMAKAQERMKQAQALMAKLREAKDPAERKRLMHEHTQALRDTMGMMRDMQMMCMMGAAQGQGMMGGGQGMGMMGQGKGKGQSGGMMPMHRMMEERMGMMQMMMEQMFERQEMLMQDK
jgi:hypothetical protein